MNTVPNLLNDDGSASMATLLMLSHHAFRRDIARFIRATKKVKTGDTSRVEALCEEWATSYRQALHGHHTIEDQSIFPDIREKHPKLSEALDTLVQQHHHIDPLLEKGDAAFSDLAHPENAQEVLNQLNMLLNEHLMFEEAEITPYLRNSKEFPTPENDEMATMYAEGFSWSMQGIASEVLVEVKKLLPEILLTKLPEAEEKFEERSKRVWGTYEVGSATTPIPEKY